jgi:transposase
MRKIRETLRLHFGLGRSARETARSVGVAQSTVSYLIQRARLAGLGWPLPDGMSETELERLLYPGNQGRPRRRPEPDWESIDRDLRRHKGMTLELAWLEYRNACSAGLQYSQFCAHYQQWRGKLDIVLRQNYRAGEKLFVDYAGPTVPIVHRKTGTTTQAQIFVAVLGASSYTYVEAQRGQDLASWLSGHVRAFAYMGGVSEVIVPDNPKTGVKEACWYEPELNPSYRDLAEHYGTVVIPARPRRPRDKAKAEQGVQLAERWVLAVLRHRIFTSLDELNEAIAELREQLNDRPFRKREGSRRSLFEALDRPALRPLPPTPYVFAEWKKATVHVDYHVEVDHNYYSAPYQLIGERLDVRVSATTVEVIHRGQRVGSHPRLFGKGQHHTDPAHRPPSQQAYLDWSPERFINWASTVGPRTAQFVALIMQEKQHPEQGYRSCLGVMRLAKDYPHERMEAAAERLLGLRVHTFRSLKSVLDRGLDRQSVEPTPTPEVPTHANVRGATYFTQEEGADRC